MTHALLVGILTSLVINSAVAAEEERPTKVRPEVQELLRKLGSDAPYGFDKAEFEAMQHEAATRPDILPDLWAAFEEGYLIPRREGKGGNGGSVGPLIHRKDLSNDQVDVFVEELKQFIELGSDEQSGDWSFTINGLRLLRNYPSPQHEELVIKFLNRGGKGSYTLLNAFETLEQIGGQRALAAMKKRVAELKVEFPEFHMIPDLEKHVAGLEARLLQNGDSSAAPAESVLPAGESSPMHRSEPNMAAAPPPWLWIIGGLAMISMIFALLKSRSER